MFKFSNGQYGKPVNPGLILQIFLPTTSLRKQKQIIEPSKFLVSTVSHLASPPLLDVGDSCLLNHVGPSDI